MAKTAALKKTEEPLGRSEELVKKRANFEKNINKWIELEDLTIGSCDAIVGKSESVVVKAIMKAIRMDSQKHKELLGIVLDCLNGTITMTPEDLGTIASLLDGHIQVERDAIEIAEQSLTDSRNFVISHILKYILEDERKHFMMANDMNTFKAHIYPYA